MTERGPVVLSYLERAYNTLYKAWSEYPWLIGIRCDLYIPNSENLSYDVYSNESMERFIASFKAKIRSHQSRLERDGARVHPCQVRYLWTREYTAQGKPHYHVVLILNHHAFCTLGQFELGRENLYNRINEAWASALGVPVSAIQGLVHFNNEEPVMPVKGGNDSTGFARLFYRASYLCKYETKGYGPWEHCFECSRL